ncbi:MAG: hypothetical protein ACREJR_00915 [Candidatus Rokuibacteriota bacterium]
MDTWMWFVLVAAAIAVVALIAWATSRSRRTAGLRDQFGPEYDRTVERTDSRREAEAELAARRERRKELDIRPLTPAARDRYHQAWIEVQARFVDQPATSLREADMLVTRLMRERGYPMDDFGQRVADVSVDHPRVVEHFRAAQGISGKTESNGASTEELRQGLVHYRMLFEELLEVDPAGRRRE